MSEDNVVVNEGANASPDEGKTEESGTFNQAQQAKVQQLIDDAYEKAYKKAQEKAQKESEALINKQVEDRLKEVKASQRKEDKKSGLEADDIQEMLAKRDEEWEAKLKERDEKVNALSSKDKENKLIMAISKHDVKNTEQVLRLISGNIKAEDDGTLSVVTDNGKPFLNKDLKPMEVSEFVTHWLSENPHFLKGSGGGAGSQSSVFGEKGGLKLNTPQDVRNLTPEQRRELVKNGMTLNIGGKEFNLKDNSNPFTSARKRKLAGQRAR